MSAEERQRLEALADQQAHSSPNTFDACDNNVMEFENILTGTHPIDVSHAGMRQGNPTNEDATRITGSDEIMPALTDTYLAWSLEQAKKGVMSFLKFFNTQTLTLHQTLTVVLGISKLLTHSVAESSALQV
ncbi:hypothetical protein F4604DRAFT_1685784 [Suillus subluteus]|nr:hypothetical protein F4604DRAFT_1685784 [Suillus subluteus]